jgi:YggT family protein
MNPGGAMIFLVQVLFDLFVMAVMLRLMLQWVRADFYNPLCQFLVNVTNPLVIPVRRVIPSIGRLDTASLVVMIALQALELAIINFLQPINLAWPQLLLYIIIKLVMMLLRTYMILIFVMVVLSWIGQGARHPAIPLVYQLTEPVLRPFRRFIPPIGGLDLSPLFALIAIQFLMRLLG